MVSSKSHTFAGFKDRLLKLQLYGSDVWFLNFSVPICFFLLTFIIIAASVLAGCTVRNGVVRTFVSLYTSQSTVTIQVMVHAI